MKIEPLSMVMFDQELYAEYDYPKDLSEVLIYFGEIPNMPDHCVLGGRSGKIYFGYHTDDLTVLDVDET